jgi:hypothetical protein
VERATRYAVLVALPDGHKAQQVADALAAIIQTLPRRLARSLTWDQGNEMAEHARFSVATGVQVYFCDPKSPWQRGSNEKHQRAAAPVPAQNHQHADPRPGRPRHHRCRAQRPTSTNTGLPDTIRSTRQGVAMTA